MGLVALFMGELLTIDRDVPRPGTWRLLLNDPHRANALSAELVGLLNQALDSAIRASVRAIVLDSVGSHFCAGFDLRSIDNASDSELRERFIAVEMLLDRVRNAPMLTVACVRGAALGAGADLVAACDYRLGTETARFAFPGTRFGLVLGTAQLVTLVGEQEGREILIEGKDLNAERAISCGLLTEIHDTRTMAERIEEIVHCAETLQLPTLHALLRLTRRATSDRSLAELVRSTFSPGFAEMVRSHAQRVARRDRRE